MSDYPPGLGAPRPESLHRERYTIAKNHDHTLVVLPSSIITQIVNGRFKGRRGPPQAAYQFEVSNEALQKIAYFRCTFPADTATHGISELCDDDPRAWRLWLEMVHGRLDGQSCCAQISTVWHVLRIADKYAISPTCADAGMWFDEWFFTQSAEGLFTKLDNVSMLAYLAL
jgi:hypothetical protein